jgi:hypothetical protein
MKFAHREQNQTTIAQHHIAECRNRRLSAMRNSPRLNPRWTVECGQQIEAALNPNYILIYATAI